MLLTVVLGEFFGEWGESFIVKNADLVTPKHFMNLYQLHQIIQVKNPPPQKFQKTHVS